MRKIKMSDITPEDLAKYLRLDPSDVDLVNELQMYLEIAKSYISNYTGLPITSEQEDIDSLDTYQDLNIVAYILVQDMYDNRSMYVDSANINKTVESILNMHVRNNL